MSKVAVVTDSTAYIPTHLLNGCAVRIAPLQLIWGDETLRDGVDIQPAQFYERLKHAKVSPSTSQPSPATFADMYRELLEEGFDILSIHISAKLSGTLDSAIQARQEFPGARIEIIDSETTAMPLGFLVLEAARAANQGAKLQEVRDMVDQARLNTGVLFAVSSLEYLRRGGRIGGAAAFLGTALNLKPILELREGRVGAVEKVRTMSKAIDRLLDLFEERIGNRRPIHIAALHAAAPGEAVELLERACQRFGESELREQVLTEVSPVVGTHTGPGTLGLCFLAGQ